MDKDLERAIKANKVSCKAGCSHCCKNLKVHCTMEEIERMVANATQIYHESENCPFLGPFGLCTVYSVRPRSCREYMVSSDPEICKTNPDAVTRVPIIRYEPVEHEGELYPIKEALWRQLEQ